MHRKNICSIFALAIRKMVAFPERNLQCGNSSVGRAQPCQGWGREFESRFPLQKPEKVEMFSRPFSFLPFGICYLSPKPPFCKGGLWSGKRGLHERPQVAPCQGVRGCKNSSREMPANAGSWLVFRSVNQTVTEMQLLFCARFRVQSQWVITVWIASGEKKFRFFLFLLPIVKSCQKLRVTLSQSNP